jgi:hypothetical protein
VSDDRIQIFISYARRDDAVPPNVEGAHGFVSFLHSQLAHELRLKGDPQPRLFRDVKQIGKGDQFAPRLQKEIERSDILLVVLSRNWISRPHCRMELDAFAERWKDRARENIVIVGKHHVGPDERHPLLQGQEGFRFYELDELDNYADADSDSDLDSIATEREFFTRGEVKVRTLFDDRVEELAAYLYRRARYLRRKRQTSTGYAFPLPQETSGPNIYVAKPAPDMRYAYDRVVRELLRRNYSVVPPPMAEIPTGSAGVSFVDEKLAGAEVSIHLLGVGKGDGARGAVPIVGHQLKRAGAKIDDDTARANGHGSAFRRLIWAPKLMASGSTQVKRDPVAVLKSFDRFRETDKVVGGSLSEFVDFLVQSLEQDTPAAGPDDAPNTPSEKDGALVYVYHRRDDRPYARSVARALPKCRVILPAVEGDDAELDRLHRQQLLDCDSVVLCWAKASEAWAKSSSNELNWKRLGRAKEFDSRCLVIGPPPGEPKADAKDFPPSEIDIVIDQHDRDPPSPEELERLLTPRKH